MSSQDERDPAEERYWRDFCPACGTRPCTAPLDSDGAPIHEDELREQRWQDTTPDPDGIASDITAAVLALLTEHGGITREAVIAAAGVIERSPYLGDAEAALRETA